jgi:hypothetical protein
MVFWLALFGTVSLAGPQVPFDADQLTELLTSRKVNQLRQASAMMENHPMQSLPFLSTVARRSNHPELTETYRLLLTYASESQLQQLASDSATQQQSLIDLERKGRENGTRRRAGVVPPSTVPPPATVPPSTVPDPAKVPSAAMTPVPRPSAVARPPTPSIAPMPAHRFGRSEPTADPKLDAINQRLRQLRMARSLSDDDWKFLLDALDGDYRSDEGAVRSMLSMVDIALVQHSFRNWSKLDERFLDPETKHPERLVKMVTRRSPRPSEVDHRIFELFQSEDAEVRGIATTYFPASRDRSDEYAATMMQWVTRDPSRRDELREPLTRCTLFGNDQTKQTVFEWLVDQIESEASVAVFDVPERRMTVASASRASMVAARMNPNVQSSYVNEIAGRAERSKFPMQYLKVLDSMSCEKSVAAPPIRVMLDRCRDPHDRLLLARHLYQAEGASSGAFSMFNAVLASSTNDPERLALALRGLYFIGPDAKSTVPRLVKLLDEPVSASNRGLITETLGAIGPDAAGAVPRLIDLSTEADRARDREMIFVALGNIGSGAEPALPLLIAAANESDRAKMTSRLRAMEAMMKIAPADPRVISTVEAVAASNDPPVSFQARDLLRRSRLGSN